MCGMCVLCMHYVQCRGCVWCACVWLWLCVGYVCGVLYVALWGVCVYTLATELLPSSPQLPLLRQRPILALSYMLSYFLQN
jgi:hypothetical protein